MLIELENSGQKSINMKWVVTEKIKERKMTCMAQLLATGLKEERDNLNMDAPTCAPETLKICIIKILQKGW